MTINDIVNKDGSLNYGTIGGFKERLDGHDQNVSSINSSLAERALDIKSVGCKVDGSTDDTTKLQLAVQTAHNMGINAIFIPPGTCMVNVQNPIYIPSNFTVLGIKGQSIVKAIASSYANAPGSTLTNPNNPNFINSLFVTGDLITRTPYSNTNQGNNIHFDGLVVDGNGQNVDQTNYTFNKSGNGSGIRGIWSITLTIKNCRVKNWLGSGIYTYSCTKVDISDNIVHDNGLFQYNANNGYSYANGLSRNGISIAGGYDNTIIGTTTPYPYSYDYVIRNNMVHNNVDEGIMFAFQKRILITGNHVHNNGDRGIEGDSGYTTTDATTDVNGDVTISYNFVYDNATHGITVDSSNNQKIDISHNIIRNCPSYGIQIQQNSGGEAKISNNMLFNVGTKNDGTQYHAIGVDIDEVNIHNNTVNGWGTGNTTPGAGISVARAITAVINGNKISNGQGHGISFNPWDQGLIGYHVFSAVISSNIVSKVKLNGINIGGSMPTNTSYNRIRQLSISGNNVFDYSEGGAQHTAYGIVIRSDVNADSVSISGNTVYEDRVTKLGANAIFFQSTTTGKVVSASITGNEISNGSDWAMLDGYQYVSYCTIAGNSWNGYKVVYGTTPPTINKWQVGDRMINSTPSVGQPKSWVCTATGTPGTWTSEGNL